MLGDVLAPFVAFDRSVLVLMMIAALSAYLGVYVVVKRIVFVGVALAEMSAMGIGFALFATGWAVDAGLDPHAWEESAPLAFSVAFTLAGVALFSVHHSGTRLSQESLIGVGYSLAAGLSVLLVWKSAEGMDLVKNLVAGDPLVVSDLQLGILAGTFAVLFALHLALRKEFVFSSFDNQTARTLSLPARALDRVLYLSIGVAVAVSLRSASILLVVALMVVPPAAAMLVARRFGHVQLLSVALAVVASGAGFELSYHGGGERGLPVSPSVVAVLAVLFLGAIAVSRWPRSRGVLGGLLAACAAAGVLLTGVSLAHVGGSIVLIDVDGLKTINDQEGHEEGDKAIWTVATAIKNVVK